ncbi:MAG: hypothetical protein ACYCOO_01770 [Chitinophagaceae bacterium]
MNMLILTLGLLLSVGPHGKKDPHHAKKIDSKKLEQCHYVYPDGRRCQTMVWKPAKFCTKHRGF